MLSYISFQNFGLEIGNKILINESNFTLGIKEKIGLIGRNGSGKSLFLNTLYKIYKKEKLEEEVQIKGKIFIPEGIKIAFVPQEIKFSFNGKVSEYLNFQTGIDVSEITKTKALAKLGLFKNVLDKDIRVLSGGEATKIALAVLFLSNYNFWILDEPTNNLDYENIQFLFEQIQKFNGGILIVSHDRKILDHLQKLIEIDEETKFIRVWGGNYSFYKRKKEEEYEARWRKYKEQEEKKERLLNEVKRLKNIAKEYEKAGSTKGIKLAKRAKAIETRIERELEELSEPQPPEKPRFPKPFIEKGGGIIFNLLNVSFYFVKNNPIFENLNITISFGDRVLIQGPNGSGKTTLIRVILGELEPTSGIVKRKENIKIGYLPQTPDLINKKQKVKDFIKEKYNIFEDNIKKILNQMKILGVMNLPISELSIGEIRKLEIASILFQNTDVLILDEPTNHLDVYTIEELVSVLKDYKGTIIFTSHDNYFIKDVNPNKVINLSGS